MPLPIPSVRDLFEGLPDAEARKILSECPERRCGRDGVIFHEDAEADALYIVKAGLVKLVALSPRGSEAILHILRPGDVFGETCLAGGKRPFTAVAVTDALLLVLSRPRLVEITSAVPGFGASLLRMLARRLGEVEREFAKRTNAWAYHRLARELIHLSADFGVDTPGGTLIDLPLTHEELANLIGTTRETVTLLLHRFEDDGIVRREHRRLVVNRRLLADYAHEG